MKNKMLFTLFMSVMVFASSVKAEIIASGDNCESGTTNCKWKVEQKGDKKILTFYTDEGVTAQVNTSSYVSSIPGGTGTLTDIVVEGTANKNENGTYTPVSGIKGSFTMWKNNGLGALQNITVPSTVTYLDGFSNTPNLKSIVIPENTNIGSSAFKNSGVESVVINSGRIDQWAFEDATHLKSIVLGDNVNFISSNALANTPSSAVIYCQEGSGHNRKTQSETIVVQSCEQLINRTYSGFTGTLISYTVDPDTGDITANGKVYSSLNNLASGTENAKPKKRIFTVQEATERTNELGGDTFTFKIRYK